MTDKKLEVMVKNVASRISTTLGWEIIGTVKYKKFKRNTYVWSEFNCKRGEKEIDQKIFSYEAGCIDRKEFRRYYKIPQYYYNEEDFYNDVIVDIYDYFHLFKNIEIVGKNDNGDEYYIRKIDYYEKPFRHIYHTFKYVVFCRPAVVGFSKRAVYNLLSTEEEAKDAIKKIIEKGVYLGEPCKNYSEWFRISRDERYLVEENIIQKSYEKNMLNRDLYRCIYGSSSESCICCDSRKTCLIFRRRINMGRRVLYNRPIDLDQPFF